MWLIISFEIALKNMELLVFWLQNNVSCYCVFDHYLIDHVGVQWALDKSGDDSQVFVLRDCQRLSGIIVNL